MLAPNSRLLLLNALRPPTGFRIDAAIATTYTLSLDALLIPPAAWALHAAGERLEAVDPILLANSLRLFADRTLIFHQAGVASPFAQGNEELSAFLDGMVMPVRVGPAETFHPKVWVLRFVSDDGEVGMRVLVGSRNLSLESTWDVLVTMDSTSEADRAASGGPLADLLRSLPGRTTVAVPLLRQALLDRVVSDLEGSHFAPPPGFETAEFLWLRRSHHQTVFPDACERRMVISPFLGVSCLSSLPRPADSGSGTSTLVSRPATLTAELARGFASYTMSTDLGTVEDGSEARIGQELHAKVFAFDTSDGSTLIVGSANATGAAFTVNDEVVVRFTGPTATMGVRALLGEPEADATATDDLELIDILQPWLPSDQQLSDTEDDGRFFEKAIRVVASVALVGECDELLDGQWRLALRFERPLVLPPGIAVEFRLLTQPSALDTDLLLGARTAEEVVTLDAVTRFVVARFRDVTGKREAVSAVLVADVEMPEGRGRRVLRSLLTNREKFARFLRYLLEGIDESGPPVGIGDVGVGVPKGRKSSKGAVLEDGPILEQLLRLLSVRPSELRFLDDAIAEFADESDILPEGFAELWDAVAPLIPQVPK